MQYMGAARFVPLPYRPDSQSSAALAPGMQSATARPEGHDQRVRSARGCHDSGWDQGRWDQGRWRSRSVCCVTHMSPIHRHRRRSPLEQPGKSPQGKLCIPPAPPLKPCLECRGLGRLSPAGSSTLRGMSCTGKPTRDLYDLPKYRRGRPAAWQSPLGNSGPRCTRLAPWWRSMGRSAAQRIAGGLSRAARGRTSHCTDERQLTRQDSNEARRTEPDGQRPPQSGPCWSSMRSEPTRPGAHGKGSGQSTGP